MQNKYKQYLKENRIYFFLALVVLLVASAPLFTSLIHYGDDIAFHMQRILSIKTGLESGNNPVRIYKDAFNGYGYGAPLFYPDILLYFPAFLCILGMPITISYNLFLIVINLVTMGIAYYSFQTITKSRKIGFLAMILYTLCTYRLVDMYSRASLGELLGMIFLPLVFCGLYLIFLMDEKKWYVLAIAMTGLLESHILTFLMGTICCVIFAMFHWKTLFEKSRLIALVKAVFVTIFVNVWFLLPFLSVSGMKVEALAGANGFYSTPIYLSQFLDVLCLNAIGAESYSKSVAGEIPLTVGVPILLGVTLYCCMLLGNKKEMAEQKHTCRVLLGVGGIALWMTSAYFPWGVVKKIPGLSSFFGKFQFAWRFLAIVSVLWAMVAAVGYVNYFAERMSWQRVMGMVTLISLLSGMLYLNQYVKQAAEIDVEEATSTSTMDTLYLLEGSDIFGREDLTTNVEGLEFYDCDKGSAQYFFSYQAPEGTVNEASYVDIGICYYPGYVVVFDGEEVPYTASDDGVIRVNLNQKCTGTMQIFYQERTLYRICDIISLVSLLVFIAYLGFTIYQSYKRKRVSACEEGTI